MAQAAFTAGNAEVYDAALASSRTAVKFGRRPVSEDFPVGYEGGWAFRTREEADSFVAARQPRTSFRLAVYGLTLPTSWEVDVSPEPEGDGVYHLVNDALLVAP